MLLADLQILILEDEPDSADLLMFVLAQEGAIVRWVTNIQDALSILEKSSFDIILSNVIFPDGDGYSFSRHWRQRERELRKRPIIAIAVTGSDREVNSKKLLESGFHDWITKPIDPLKIGQTIADAITRLQDLI